VRHFGRYRSKADFWRCSTAGRRLRLLAMPAARVSAGAAGWRHAYPEFVERAVSPPHIARRLDDEREFAALILDGEGVAGEIAGEAALRAQA
jgi:hypothetical protein